MRGAWRRLREHLALTTSANQHSKFQVLCENAVSCVELGANGRPAGCCAQHCPVAAKHSLQITQETTSLLMKELDTMRAAQPSTSSGITLPGGERLEATASIIGVNASANARLPPLPHRTQSEQHCIQPHRQAFHTGNGDWSIGLCEQPQPSTSHASDTQLDVSSSGQQGQSVARAIYQAVKNRCRQRGSSLGNLTHGKQQMVVQAELNHSAQHDNIILNGHAHGADADYKAPLQRTTSSGSPSPARRRGKSRFLLDLRSPRRARTPPSTTTTAVTTVPAAAAAAGRQHRQSDGEHGLIALNSALLHSNNPTREPMAAQSPPQSPTQLQHQVLIERVHSPVCSNTTMSVGSVGLQQQIVLDDQQPCSSSALLPNNSHSNVMLPDCCLTRSPSIQAFFHARNRTCTSYRLKIATMKNPVDTVVLPNGCLAVADYDNGFLILNRAGDVVRHCAVADNKNACGVACQTENTFRLIILAYKDGGWSINLYAANFELIETVICPEDLQIETWAMRKIALAQDGLLYLMATGENKLVIWSYDFNARIWRTLGWTSIIRIYEVTENSRRGAYNDFAIRYDPVTREIHFLLCDWKKAQLSMVVVTADVELAGIQSVKMRRSKGQEWIVQGPKLACWDADGDIILYDGSGKLFLFDGEKFRCKKIISDLGKGEVSAVAVKDGWCYALCRYRLTIEAYVYKQVAETSL